jgi:hypothetical protein
MCNVHSCSVEGDIEFLTNFKDGQMTIGSRDRSNQKWGSLPCQLTSFSCSEVDYFVHAELN